MKIQYISFVLFFGSVLATPSFAQNQVKNSVIGNGGSATSNALFQLKGTIGQTNIGLTQNENNQIQGGFWAQAIDLVTSVKKLQDESIPDAYKLHQNYPNPFNPTTTIAFALPQQSDVSIKLFDLHGRIVSILLDEELAAGEYQIIFDAHNIPSGVYFYRIDTEGFVQTKKITLLK